MEMRADLVRDGMIAAIVAARTTASAAPQYPPSPPEDSIAPQSDSESKIGKSWGGREYDMIHDSRYLRSKGGRGARKAVEE